MVCLLQANAALTQQLADHNHLLAALREEAAELAGQLLSAQASVAAKDKLIQQLKAMIGTGDAAGAPWFLYNLHQPKQSVSSAGNSRHSVCAALGPGLAWFLAAVWLLCGSACEKLTMYAATYAGRLSDADGGEQTGSSTPSTRSPSKSLSRQTSRSGLNHHLAVGQVRSCRPYVHRTVDCLCV